MKPYIFLYCEGNETKAVVVSKEKTGLKIHRTIASSSDEIDSNSAPVQSSSSNDFNIDNLSEDFSFEDSGTDFQSEETEDSSDVSILASELSDINLGHADFIPIISEPQINYHIFESSQQSDRKKLLAEAKKEILESKGLHVQDDILDCIELNNTNILAAYLEGNTQCVNYIYNLASHNGKRYYKIPTLKSADISLSYFVSKTTKFFPEDNTLIIYIGKEYSKLIFLEGQKLKHIGSTLDIGTKNLHTYDVYFSKILLEMENGGIPRLDNIIICGEDRSENLVLSFYGTFPEANVNQLEFDSVDTSMLSEESLEELSSFTIPIAAAIDYFDDLDKVHTGIKILPKFVVEQQKFLQFGWHSYAVFPFIFAATFYFTLAILGNYKDMNDLNREIQRQKQMQMENEALLKEINPRREKAANFENTQALLDSVTVGTEFWSKTLDDISSFMERRRNFWVKRIEVVEDSIQVSGYSLSRKVLTEFADKYEPSVLRNMLYEPMRRKNTFTYLLNIMYPDRIQKLLQENSGLRE